MRRKFARSYRRRGAAIVATAAVGFPIFLVAAALAIDFGKIFGSQADLQRAADAAALAAAGAMATLEPGDGQLTTARDAATAYVEANPVFGEEVTIDASVDVVFGVSERNVQTNVYSFTPTENKPNAVRVNIRHTANSPNGPASLLFAKSFGVSTTNISGQATAAFFEDSNGDSSSDSSDDSMDGSSVGSSDSSSASDDASGGSNDSDSSGDGSSGDSQDGSAGESSDDPGDASSGESGDGSDSSNDGSSGAGEDSSDSGDNSSDGSGDGSSNDGSSGSGEDSSDSGSDSSGGIGDESSDGSGDNSSDGPPTIVLIE